MSTLSFRSEPIINVLVVLMEVFATKVSVHILKTNKPTGKTAKLEVVMNYSPDGTVAKCYLCLEFNCFIVTKDVSGCNITFVRVI